MASLACGCRTLRCHIIAKVSHRRMRSLAIHRVLVFVASSAASNRVCGSAAIAVAGLLDMRTSLGCCILLLVVAWPALALDVDVQPCPDAALLLPFVTSQIKQGISLIVFQGTAVPKVSGFGV